MNEHLRYCVSRKTAGPLAPQKARRASRERSYNLHVDVPLEPHASRLTSQDRRKGAHTSQSTPVTTYRASDTIARSAAALTCFVFYSVRNACSTLDSPNLPRMHSVHERFALSLLHIKRHPHAQLNSSTSTIKRPTRRLQLFPRLPLVGFVSRRRSCSTRRRRSLRLLRGVSATRTLSLVRGSAHEGDPSLDLCGVRHACISCCSSGGFA